MKELESETGVPVELERAPEPNEKLVRHPLSALFPLVSEKELMELGGDIHECGLRQKIVMYDGAVLDGWSRVLAASRAGIELGSDDFRDFDEEREGSPLAYVKSINLRRRHMTDGQRGAVGATLYSLMPKQKPGPKPAGDKAGIPTLIPNAAQRLEEVAQDVGVSVDAIKDAVQAAKHAPDEFEKLKAGKTTLHKAARKAQKRIAGSEYDAAFLKVQKICGEGFAAAIKEDQIQQMKTPRHVIELAKLSDDKMQAVVPSLRLGWKLSQALGYLSMELSPAHSFEQGINLLLSRGTDRLELNFSGFDVVIKDVRPASEKVAVSPAPTKAKRQPKAFTPPTREQLVAYAKEKGIPERLAGDQWEAWNQGDRCDGLGNPILNWKSKLITFEKQGYGMFAERAKGRADDELERKRRASREAERINREDELRQKQKNRTIS